MACCDPKHWDYTKDYDAITQKNTWLTEDKARLEAERDAAIKAKEDMELKMKKMRIDLYDAQHKVTAFEERAASKKAAKKKAKKKAAIKLKTPKAMAQGKKTKGLPVNQNDVKMANKQAAQEEELRQAEATLARIASQEADDENDDDDDDDDDNKMEVYQKVAEAIPEITLAHVLHIQKEFLEADADNSNLLDASEISQVLTRCAGEEITVDGAAEILKQVDSDGSNQLDFLETVLAFDKFNKKEIVMPEDMQHKTGRRGTILASKKKAAAGADGKTESKACVVS